MTCMCSAPLGKSWRAQNRLRVGKGSEQFPHKMGERKVPTIRHRVACFLPFSVSWDMCLPPGSVCSWNREFYAH